MSWLCLRALVQMFRGLLETFPFCLMRRLGLSFFSLDLALGCDFVGPDGPACPSAIASELLDLHLLLVAKVVCLCFLTALLVFPHRQFLVGSSDLLSARLLLLEHRPESAVSHPSESIFLSLAKCLSLALAKL